MSFYKIIFSVSLYIVLMFIGCVSQRDVCYSDGIAPYDTLCEGLFFVGSAARTISDQEREETYNVALVPGPAGENQEMRIKIQYTTWYDRALNYRSASFCAIAYFTTGMTKVC